MSDERYEKERLAFEMHHEMTYHEMCGVIARLHEETDRLEGVVAGLKADNEALRAALRMMLVTHVSGGFQNTAANDVRRSAVVLLGGYEATFEEEAVAAAASALGREPGGDT